MNNGKICVSVCAETAEEFIENIKRAEESADVIELRFDCLELKQIFKTFALLNSRKPLLFTFRPKEQGGKSELSLENRTMFWKTFVVNSLLDKRKIWIDFEFDFKNKIQKLSNPVTIRSFHDFAETPDNLIEIYEELSDDSEVAKIAVQADDITDSIAVWNLLENAKRDNKQIIPIAMGEAGKWTRILGLAHGAFMTYAALEEGNETAPGQISAHDLIEIYRVKELDEQTEIYGILGNPVSHSLSPFIHNTAFKFHNLNAVFIPFEVKSIDEFIEKFVREKTREIELNFKGFSVTIPHKKTIIKHLDSIDETAQRIGAVNTVKIIGGRLHGFNTDAQGFIEPLQNCYGDLRGAKVAVLGNGGAARACVYALKKENADVAVFGRDVEKAKNLADKFYVSYQKLQTEKGADEKPSFKNFDILVNATPLGTKGEFENETPVFAEQIEPLKLVYDLVYNPFETRLIKEAQRANVPTLGGLAMLVEQAKSQFEIWTGRDAPMKEIGASAFKRLK